MSTSLADARYFLNRMIGLFRRSLASLRTRGWQATWQRIRVHTRALPPLQGEPLYLPAATPFAPFTVPHSVALAIVLVGVVYWLLLRGALELSGGAWVADLLLHSATPVLVPLWWLGFAPKGGLTGRDPWRWAALPVVYFAYALARGAAEGRYAYPFLDVGRIGWGQTLLTALVMGLGFVVGGFALVWIDRRMAARR